MAEQVSYTLEEYKIQREYRQEKRKEYIMRFEAIRQKMGMRQKSVMIEQK